MGRFKDAEKRINAAMLITSDQRRGMRDRVILKISDVFELLGAYQSADAGLRRYYEENKQLHRRILELESKK